MRRADTHFTELLEPLSRQVVRVAEATGMTPERIAIGDVSEAELEGAYLRADAIVVMGGEDVTPELYGMTADYLESGPHLGEADKRSCAIIRRAIVDGTPLLGICRGLQLLNVACGGTLEQHLPNADAHRYLPPRDGDFIRHPVDIEPGSRLAEYLGTHLDEVESSHHQVAADAGAGLRIVARASDGTAEGLEHETSPAFAVQWHPEAASSEPSQLPALLAGLRDAAGLRAGVRLRNGGAAPEEAVH